MQHGRQALSVLAAVLAGAHLSIAEDSAKSEGFIDGAVRDIEIAQHERLLKVQSAPGSVLAPFTTDGCSGGMSATWTMAAGVIASISKRHGSEPPWTACCVAHDRLYHAGVPAGADAAQSFDARLKADEALRQCVRQVGVERVAALSAEYGLGEDDVRLLYDGLAEGMYGAVRVGGAPCTGLSWRWGYGWPNCK
jgi:hypothetical protein